MPDLETTPIVPRSKNWAGMIPTLALPGERIPGQLGPTRRQPVLPSRWLKTRSSSWAGMPSVIAMTSAMLWFWPGQFVH